MAKIGELNIDQRAVLELVSKKDAVRARFFKRAFNGIWFCYLQRDNFFCPNESLYPQENNVGGYFFPNWEILQYLEKLVERINDKKEEYVDYRDILGVMKQTAEYINNGHTQLSQNYYIGSRFVNLFYLIPEDKYSLDDLRVLSCWMNEEEHDERMSSEVYLHLLPKLLKDVSEESKQKSEYLFKAVLARYKNNKSNKNDDIYWIKEFFVKNTKLIMCNNCFSIFFNILFEKLEQILKKKETEISIEQLGETDLLVKLIDKDSNYELVISNEPSQIVPKDSMSSFVSFYNVIKEQFLKICTDENQSKKYAWLLYSGLYNENSFESVYAIEDTFSWDVVSTLVCAIKRFFEFRDNDTLFEEIKEAIKQCLYSKFFLLSKLGMFGIGQMLEPHAYSEIFTDALQDERTYLKIFESYLTEAELAKVLNKITDKGSLNIIKHAIEIGPEIIEDFDGNRELEKELWKQERCRELRHISEFNDMYNALYAQTNMDRYLTPAISFTDSKLKEMFNESPYSVQQLLTMEPQEVEISLNNFKQVSHFSETTFHGLGKVVQKVAEVSPDKFLKHRRYFLDVGYIYIYNILVACNTLIKNKKFTLWNEMFAYLKELMVEKEFWDNKFMLEDRVGWKADSDWIVSITSEILLSISEDENEIICVNIDKIVEIIKLISKNANKELDEPYEKVIQDLPNYLINNSWSKLMYAWLSLAFKFKKQKNNDSKQICENINLVLEETKKEFLTTICKPCEVSVATAGLYFLLLYSYDSRYALKIKDEIMRHEPKIKSLFLVAYLRYNNLEDKISCDLFELYKFGVEEKFDAKIRERLIGHIALEYLVNTDQRFSTLFERIHMQNHADDIVSIIKCFANNLKEENLKKIYDYWHAVMKIENFKSEADKQMVYATTAELAQSMKTFDSSESGLILKATSAIGESDNLFYVVEMIDRVKTQGDLQKTLTNIFKFFIICFSNGHPIFDTDLRDSIMNFVAEKEDEGKITGELLSLKVQMDDVFANTNPTDDLYPEKA